MKINQVKCFKVIIINERTYTGKEGLIVHNNIKPQSIQQKKGYDLTNPFANFLQ